MKRKLLLVVVLLCITQILTSQTIDLVGMGIKNNTTSNLTFTDVGTIDSVQVTAIFSGAARANAGLLYFDGNLEAPVTTFYDDANVINLGSIPDRDFKGSYFSATFKNIDASGVNAHVVETSKSDFHSFYALVYRNTGEATFKSFVTSEIVWHYENGSADPYVYNIPINNAGAERNIVVKIPITELANDERSIVIDITAGDKTRHIEETVYNLGDSFFLGEYAIEGVAGNVDNVSVSIYSPNPYAGEAIGDSFFANGVVVDVDVVDNEDPGCTLTQGYWKTHTKYDGDKKYDSTWAGIESDGEDTMFFTSEKSYYQVLKRAPRGNPYYILAHQFIAAELNFLKGADPSEVQEAFDKTKRIFTRYTPGQVMHKIKYGGRKGRQLKNKMTRLARKLDNYNNGTIGPGHCDDDEEEPENECLSADDILVTPNPINSYGSVKFTATQGGRTKVYLYNSYGQPICPLFDQRVVEGQEIDFGFSARRLRNGIYYLKVWKGCCVAVKRVVVRCY